MQNPHKARCQWLTPIILATQEAEIRRILVQSQAGQIVQDPVLKKPITKKVWWNDSRCDLEFKPQYHKKKRKEKKKIHMIISHTLLTLNPWLHPLIHFCHDLA
jgi:hypothetical protein